MSSSSQRTDSASTSTNHRNNSACIVNAVTGEFANSARCANLGCGHPHQLYLRDGDLQNMWNVEGELKRSRVVPGRIGLSLLVPTGLDMLDETLAEDRDAALGRTARIAADEA